MASIPTATGPHPVRSPQGEVPRLTEAAVVVPVRNEEALLPACVRHLGAALDRLAGSHPAVGGSVLLLLDACTDASRDIARAAAAADPRFAWAAVDERSVGRVRAEGAHRVLRRALRGAPGTGGTAAADRSAPAGRPATVGGAAASGLWLASTDADTRVPVHWLEAMVAHADAGADAVLGTVEPDPEELDPGRLAHWRARHRLGDGHPFIHGANLGVRASAYLRAGGFPPVAAHEDVRLVEALRAHGARIVASGGVHAVTSARFDGRAPQGFAGYLERLG